MKAGETTVKDLLEGDKIYVVPRYQRRYSWTKTEWEPLWRAILSQYLDITSGTEPSNSGHFIGSVVCAHRDFLPTEAPNFDVIDGQQRLTTLSIFLAALRDAIPETDQARSRASAFISNQFESGDYAHKVLPGDADKASVHSILSGDIGAASGLPLSAYRFFEQRILSLKPIDDHAALVRAATVRLEVVQILTGGGDNAHRIFQTLNSTGKELTAVDLLRNHFFMLLPTNLDAAYDDEWMPMEQRLQASFTTFLWIDLVTRPGLEGVPNKPDRIYGEWQSLLEPIAGDEAAVMAALRELGSRSLSYIRVLEAATGNVDIDRCLSRLRAWGSAVHVPLTFSIVEMWRHKQIETSRVVNALEYVESFLVRRMLAGHPTNNLNRMFTTSVGQLAQAPDELDHAVRRILSQPGKYWPQDEELHLSEYIPFYEKQRPIQRQFILRRLEERIAAPYAPDWSACNFTIEHVLPQKMTAWWSQHLEANGENEPAQAHESLRHTLGNLTLTCENPALGQMSFSEKCSIYAGDVMKMNDDITKLSAWSRSQIEERGRALLRRACEVWPAPFPPQTLSDYDMATNVRVGLELIEPGKWVAEDVFAEFLEAEHDELERSLELLGDDARVAFVLSSSGHIRDAVRGTSVFNWMSDSLIQAGIFPSGVELESNPQARADLSVTLAELRAASEG